MIIRKMKECDVQYHRNLRNVYENGYEDGVNERTGISTKRLPGLVIRVDVEEEFPILTTKFVAGKTAQREIEWIWKTQSNNIKDLAAKIWDEWADENGSIKKAYGYQIHKPVHIYSDIVNHKGRREYQSQAHYIIEYLKEFPNGRHAVATLWNVDDLSDMGLMPCCHTSTWNLDGGRLNCVLDQRSGDMPYGVPFNTTQYAELMCMIARELGVKPGILTHVIADAHIYANQMKGVELQLAHYDLMEAIANAEWDNVPYYANRCEELNPSKKAEEYIELATAALDSTPHFEIYAPKGVGFFDYTADDCKVEDYVHMGKIDFGDVAV